MTRYAPRLAAATLATFVSLPMPAPLACAVPEGADLAAADTGRMEEFETARTRGLGEALLTDNAEERGVVAALFSPAVIPADTMPDGKYRCRTLKLGGINPLVVYDWFSCQISEDATRIEKTSGSQRFTGSLTPSEDGLFYQGAGHYNDDPPKAYGDEADFNQVGCLYQVSGTGAYRLELPFPVFESTHDVIELMPGK